MFEGVYTAIVTPFREDKVDFEKLNELIELIGKGDPSTFTDMFSELRENLGMKKDRS